MQPPKALQGVVRGLHHVAIAVTSVAEARSAYEALGLAASEPEFVPEQRVNVLMLRVDARAGSQRIELVEPASADSPISKFLEKRGPGLHHLAWKVDDCVRAIAQLKAAGLKMIDEAPRSGSHGTKVAFVHPKSTGGVLMELVEEPRGGAR